MTLYVVEIAGRGAVAYEAGDADEAGRCSWTKSSCATCMYCRIRPGRFGTEPLRSPCARRLPTRLIFGALSGGSGMQPADGDNSRGWVFLIPVVDPSNFYDEDGNDNDDDRDDGN